MKQNKFLTGFLIVTVLGAGVLGFLLFQAKGKYNEAYDAYTSKAGELAQLQTGKPFPDESNYKKMLELQEKHQETIDDLQTQLAASEFPLEPLRPNEFQDRLKATVDKIRGEAQKQGVKLPDGKVFALDFDPYLASPPRDEAAAPLGRMLKAMEKAVLQLIKTAPSEIKGVKRTPLPEEGGKNAQQPAPQKGGKADRNQAQPLVQRFPFEVEFIAHEAKARGFINAMVSAKDQFYIPAAISILNQQQNGPSKLTAAGGLPPEQPPAPPAENPPGTPPATPPGAAPNPGANPAPATPVPAVPAEPAELTKFVVGEEKLDVLARFDIVDFSHPAEKDADKKGGKKGGKSKGAEAKSAAKPNAEAAK